MKWRIWPWSALADAKAEARGAQIAKVQGQEALIKAGNLWAEAHQTLESVDGSLAAADYRIRRVDGESWPDYRRRLQQTLHQGRAQPAVLAILDRLDSKTREAFTLWLTEADPAKAEIGRQRASALADFRSELVMALYAEDASQRRQEVLRRGQEHARIYLDNRQAQGIAANAQRGP